MIMSFKITKDSLLNDQPLGEFAYSFDCTFFKLICLTAKTFHKIATLVHPCTCGIQYILYITMPVFLVGATELKKRTLKRAQLRIPELCKS